jgi:hypothetical protein
MSRITLQDLIQDNFPDNTTNFITPELARELYDAMVVESFIKTSDDAEDVSYVPNNTANWNTPEIPTNTGLGLNILAFRVKELESITKNLLFLANRDSPLSNFIAIQGAFTITTEHRQNKVSSVIYQTSINQGDTYISHASFNAFRDFCNDNSNSLTTFYIRLFMTIPSAIGDQPVIVKYRSK